MPMEKDKKICCICGKEFTERGNNPYPVKEDGECCRACNWTVVLPKRAELSKRENERSMDSGVQYKPGEIQKKR